VEESVFKLSTTVERLESIVEKLQRDNGNLKGVVTDLSAKLEVEKRHRKLIEHRLLGCESRLDFVERNTDFEKSPTVQGNKSGNGGLIFREGRTPKNEQRRRRQSE
jgi:hypothetical protein